MKTTQLFILFLIAVVMSLSSCDPLSSVEYGIHNMTKDTVTVTMHTEILSSTYQGYTIHKNDSVSIHYGEDDSVSVAVLAPDQYLEVKREWNGLYHEEQLIPLWKYIKSITVGVVELKNASWDNEQAWHLKTKGGGRFQGESRYYDLYLRD